MEFISIVYNAAYGRMYQVLLDIRRASIIGHKLIASIFIAFVFPSCEHDNDTSWSAMIEVSSEFGRRILPSTRVEEIWCSDAVNS